MTQLLMQQRSLWIRLATFGYAAKGIVCAVVGLLADWKLNYAFLMRQRLFENVSAIALSLLGG